jgi:hypothetical protein
MDETPESDGHARAAVRMDSSELPNCPCGEAMLLERTQIISADAQVKIYRCRGCARELRLTVWAAEAVGT